MRKILTYTGVFMVVTFVTVAVLNFSVQNSSSKEPAKNTMPASVIVSQEASTTEQVLATLIFPVFHYIEITNGCGPYYDVSPCVNMRSGPGVEYPIVTRLRTGMVLKVEGTLVQDGYQWYKIIFDGEIRYPERVTGDWYVAADPLSVRPFNDLGDSSYMMRVNASTTKRITIDLSEEALYAYDGDVLFVKEPISTGLEFTPTPRGTFNVFYKTPSRYMQGPIPGVSDQEYDLPGVPWNLYFTVDGAVIHGAYWHDHFGEPWSHGCVNLSPQNAQKLYEWADLGTPVTVQD